MPQLPKQAKRPHAGTRSPAIFFCGNGALVPACVTSCFDNGVALRDITFRIECRWEGLSCIKSRGSEGRCLGGALRLLASFPPLLLLLFFHLACVKKEGTR